MLKYKVITSVSMQLSVFLYTVVPEGLLQIFDYQELELVVSGVPIINMDDWRENTTVRYKVKDRPSDLELNNIEWLWKILRKEFTEDQRARMLQFVTGSSRVPANGFKTLLSHSGIVCTFNIRMMECRDESSLYCKAHTCFNRLDLPTYRSYEEMKKYLTLVLSMDITGFSME